MIYSAQGFYRLLKKNLSDRFLYSDLRPRRSLKIALKSFLFPFFNEGKTLSFSEHACIKWKKDQPHTWVAPSITAEDPDRLLVGFLFFLCV